MMAIARVFPRKTKATPDDALAFYGLPTLFAYQQPIDEIHVSVTFTWDIPIAEQLAELWAKAAIAPVKIGGPAYEKEKALYPIAFTPGRYVKPGYTFTSRGCPRRCFFCSVWKRWGNAIPLDVIQPGWNILDDNLLACPRPHVERVFAMLRQQTRRVEFTGGLEAKALEEYHVDLLASLKPRPTMFWAYDPGDSFAEMERAARLMLAAGFTRASHRLRCYVLIGYPKDTMEAAEMRLMDMVRIGFTPMAMLWKPERLAAEKYRPGPEWRAFQRRWVRPAIIHAALPPASAPATGIDSGKPLIAPWKRAALKQDGDK